MDDGFAAMFLGPKLGELLVEAGAIDELQLGTALAEQQSWGGRLGITLIKLGYLDEHGLVRALATQLGVPVARLDGKRVRPEVLEVVPAELARRYLCLPLFLKKELGSDTLYLGMEDPCDLDALDALAFRTGMRVRPVMVAPSELLSAIDRLYAERTLPPRAIEIDARPAPTLSEPTAVAETAGPAAESTDVESTSARDVTSLSPSTEGHAASTRSILHALAQLLIEKQLVGRDELYERVSKLRNSADPEA